MLLAVAAGAIAVFYFAVDPEQVSYAPFCLFHKLTGLQCPGCGSQRMAHALLHGDFAAAWHYNALLLCFLPLLAFMLWLEIVRSRRPRLYARFYHPVTVLTIAAVIVTWTIVRNVCGF